jgi:hypothetical protein
MPGDHRRHNCLQRLSFGHNSALAAVEAASNIGRISSRWRRLPLQATLAQDAVIAKAAMTFIGSVDGAHVAEAVPTGMTGAGAEV